jgi:hypothetical protein
MIIEGRPFPSVIDPIREYFDKIESVEITDILKLDFEKGIRICVANIHMKKGFRLADLNLPKETRVLRVLKEEESTCTAMVKVSTPAELLWTSKKLNLNVIWEVPIIKSIDRFAFGCIGDDEELRKLLDAVKEFGEITSIRFQKPTFRNHSPTDCLTDKQRRVVSTARKLGYYEYPRRINAKQLAEKVGLSQATTLEHLRKAESRLMASMLD